MRKVPYILLIGFFICILVFSYHTIQFIHSGATYGIISLQLATTGRIGSILAEWNSHQLLPMAQYNTTIDFFFITFYVLLLVLYTRRQVRQETNLFFSILLRINVWVAVAAGILDGIENIIMLRNVKHFASAHYESTRYIAIAKFVLIGWVVFTWLISKMFSARKKQSLS